MEKMVQSEDGVTIHYQVSDTKPIALVFVHGWLGNAGWWNIQRDYFQENYTVVQIDLPGREKSGKERVNWTSTQYAKDIRAVVEQLASEEIVLVGHSMSGPYTLEASLLIPRVKLVVLVDTVKDPDKFMNYQQANELLFASYRKDFKNAVQNFLPNFLFAKTTPVTIREQLQKEFLANDVEFAIASLEPLYKMDLQNIAKQVRVPVRAINSDYMPTNADSIRKYISDFAYVTISGTGHYPMLEDPDAFNHALEDILQKAVI